MRVLIFALSFLLVAGLSCQSAKESSSNKGWAQDMQSFADGLQQIFPLTIQKNLYAAPENRSRVESVFDQLLESASRIKDSDHFKEMAKNDSDPSLGLFAGSLEKDLLMARAAYLEGNRDYSRLLLRNAVGLCIQCHTRGQTGPEFVVKESVKNYQLGRIEQAELYQALRRYDEALDLYKQILVDPVFAKRKSLDWEKALYAALRISMMAQQDIGRTMQIVESALSQENVPQFLQEDLREWRSDLLSWKNEKNTPSLGDDKTANALVTFAEKLISKRTTESSPRGKYVSVLRGTGILHNVLRTKSQASAVERAEIMWRLGHAYEDLSFTGIDSLHQFYFKTCVLTVPHTATALRCFNDFEESLWIEQLRGQGISIPASYLEYLEYLRAQASPQKSPVAR